MNSEDASGDGSVSLSRSLGLLDVTMIGVGAMIGAGVFVLTGIAAGAAGPALILSFALNGIVTIFTAMVYAELGSAIPEAGGGYLWVREGLPGPNAFQAGWMSWFAHAVAGSLYALGFGAFLALVFEQLEITLGPLQGPWFEKLLAVAIVLIFLAINFRGVSETGTAGNVVTILKVVILLVFIVSGIVAIFRNPEYLNKFTNFAPNGWPGILNAMGLTFVAFEGYEIIVQAGEETKNPRKTIPKAIFLSLAIVVPIYIFVAFAALGAVNPDTNIPTFQWLAEHAELGVAEAARQFMPFGTILLLVGGLLSTMSALNATTFSSTRVSFAMGRDKNLPDAFADINPWTRTPHKALFISGALIIFMALVIPIEDVAAAADIMFLLLFLQVNVAVITLRKKYGDRLKYGYLMPFFPIVPIIGIVTKLFLAIFLFGYSPIAWVFTIVWLAVGFVIYYTYARPRMKTRARTPVVLEEKRVVPVPEEKRYTVLVPVANPASLPVLLEPAVRAARDHDGIVTLLHVITVPEQLPLSAGREYIAESKPLTEEGLVMVEEMGVSGEVIVRISHDPSDAIIQTAFEREADLLILGWRGKSSDGRRSIGRNVDRIIEEVNCNSIVLQQTAPPPYRRILVPIADPLQTRSALDKARLLLAEGGMVDVLHVFKPSDRQPERDQFMAALNLQLEGWGGEYPEMAPALNLEAVSGDDVVETITDRAHGYDSVILGASRDGWLTRQFFGNTPARIAEAVEPPVVLVKPRHSPMGYSLRRVVRYFQGGYREIDRAAEKELREQGILTPEPHQDAEDLHSSVNQLPVVLSGILSVVGVVLMFIGQGETLTWIGTGFFIVALFWFTWISLGGSGAEAVAEHAAGD